MNGERKPEEKLIRNLQDAGCTRQTIEDFLRSHSLKSIAGQKNILTAQRKKLLDDVHRDQRRLDCLDYLIFHLKKTAWKDS